MHKFNLRVTAVFLLLVLTQSMGLRIMLHNKFHLPVHNSASHTDANNIQISCDCIDEALMPLTPAQVIEVTVPVSEHITLQQEPRYFLPVVARIFRSLRAPPAA